jgi:polyhydroxybutyrate depolymerase
MRGVRRYALMLVLAASTLALSGCLVVRGARMIESHNATQGFADKGDVSKAQPRTIVAGGLQRRYLVQIPSGGGAPMPIVVVLHGGTQTAEQAWEQTSLPTLGLREHFIVAAPQGVDKHWNDGRGSTLAGDSASTADDVAFIRDMVAELVLRDRGDARAVFVIGASNGGFMAMYYACQASDTLRAGANVISDLPANVARGCKPGKALPWLSMNGVKDPVVPFKGMTEGSVVKGQPQAALLSADATFQFWASRAGCSSTAQTTRIADGVEKRVRLCANGATSQQYVFENGGHVWPGLPVNSPALAYYLGGANLEVDTGEVAWGFFKSTLGTSH